MTDLLNVFSKQSLVSTIGIEDEGALFSSMMKRNDQMEYKPIFNMGFKGR